MVMAMAAGLFTVGCFGPLVAIHVRDTLHSAELKIAKGNLQIDWRLDGLDFSI